MYWFFFSSRRRHTICALVTGVQTCALPIFSRSLYRGQVIGAAASAARPKQGVFQPIPALDCQEWIGEGRIMPSMPRNLTRLTLAGLMLASSLASTPLLAGPAQADPAPVQVDSASWTKPDPAMDKFITDLMAKMTLEEKIGQLSLLTSDWESTGRSEEHTSELQSLMRNSYAVFCLTKK